MSSRPTNAEVAQRYAQASVRRDRAAMSALRHPDWTSFWPQSGELVLGDADFQAILRAYPGGAPQVLALERIVGDEDRWVVSAADTVMRVAGSGAFWWGEWRIGYPDGSVWDCVSLMELRDGLVWREVVYWAAPFAAPAWRSAWVTRVARAEPPSPG